MKFLKSFAYAFNGVVSTVRAERNMRVHLAFTFYVSIAALMTGASSFEWIAICLCFALVMGAEAFNTALERLCDAAHPDYSEKIRFAKDAAAGAVLVCAALSAAVGGIIFFNGEKIGRAVSYLKGNLPITALLALSLIPAALFIIGRKKK